MPETVNLLLLFISPPPHVIKFKKILQNFTTSEILIENLKLPADNGGEKNHENFFLFFPQEFSTYIIILLDFFQTNPSSKHYYANKSLLSDI